MAYRVFIDKAAEKDIDRLPKNIRKLVLEEIKGSPRISRPTLHDFLKKHNITKG